MVRAAEARDLSAALPVGDAPLEAHWLWGPANSDSLDVAIVSVRPGGETSPHLHIGGQVIVATAGRGFVEANDDRIMIEAGDVVICPPGELHVHGALADASFAHLTITTGGYRFPGTEA